MVVHTTGISLVPGHDVREQLKLNVDCMLYYVNINGCFIILLLSFKYNM